MNGPEHDMLSSDYDELSDTDIAVIMILDDKNPTPRTRLQKVSLLYHEIFGTDAEKSSHSAYFFGGYSDEVDESASDLSDIGIIKEERNGYILTDYGIKLKEYIKRYCDDQMIFNIPKIVASVSELKDRDIVGLTYHFYKDTTRNSTIKSSVEKMNDTASFDGKKLSEISITEFENKLRNGKIMRSG